MASTLKVIIPKPLNTASMRTTLRDGMKEYAPHLLKSFQHTTDGFKEIKPKFTAKMYVLAHSISIKVEIGGDDKSVKVWNYLDEGTRPHVIRAKGKKALSFKWGGPGSYKAKTRPRDIYSGGGGISPDAKRVAFKKVHHPGTEAREWRTTITKMHTPFFVRYMTSVFNEAAIASGHAIMTSGQGMGAK
jgi:hypothetical protein